MVVQRFKRKGLNLFHRPNEALRSLQALLKKTSVYRDSCVTISDG